MYDGGDDYYYIAKQGMVNVVAWLEDQCIRLYEPWRKYHSRYDIEARVPLRTNDLKWNQAFTQVEDIIG